MTQPTGDTTAQRHLSLADLNLIPIFTGSEPPSFETFYERLQLLAAHNSWTEAEQLFILKLKISGPASQIIRANRDLPFTELIELIRRRFSADITPATELQKIQETHFASFKDAQFFFDELETHASKLGLGDIDKTVKESLLSSFALEKLPPHIKRNVIARNPTSYSELKTITLLEQKAWNSIAPPTPKPPDVTPPPQVAPMQRTPSIADQLNDIKSVLQNLTLRTLSPAPSTYTPICFFCQKRGHVKSRCRLWLANRQNWSSNIYYSPNYRDNTSTQPQRYFRGQYQNRERFTNYPALPPPQQNYSQNNVNTNRGYSRRTSYGGYNNTNNGQNYQNRQTPRQCQTTRNQPSNQNLPSQGEQHKAPSPIITFPPEEKQPGNNAANNACPLICTSTCPNSPISSNTPIVQATIQGTPVKFLVDTGACTSILYSNVMQLLNPRPHVTPTNLTVSLVTGETTNLTEQTTLPVVLNNKSYTCNFHLTNNPVSNMYHGILGMNFLSDYPFFIHCQEKCIYEMANKISWSENALCNYDVKTTSDTNIYLTGKHTIPPLSMMHLCAAPRKITLHPGDFLFEPSAKMRHSNIIAARSVSRLQKSENTFTIQVINLSTSPIHIPKHTCVGSVSHIHTAQLGSETAKDATSHPFYSMTRSEKEKEFDLSAFNLEGVPMEYKDRLINLLSRYRHIFATKLSELPGCDTILHEVKLTDDIPVRCKPYKTPVHLQETLNSQVDDMLQNKIIQYSSSGYNAPILLVKKKDNTWRFVCDFRSLNKKVIPDVFPLPNITDALEKLGDSHVFSSFDLSSGYFQQKVLPSDTHKLAFSTSDQHYEFTRTPFGLNTSGIGFIRLLSTVLAPLKDDHILCYVDDILVPSVTYEDNLNKLERVFQCLSNHKLRLKPSKCSFLQTSISFLGHQISQGTIRPLHKNIDIIQKFKTPTSKKDIRSFLGCVGFYRRFIPDFSRTAHPLIRLTSANNPFQWTDTEQQAFDTLRFSLLSSVCLKIPDLNKQFVVYCDASGYALGAVLSQIGPDKFPRPVQFASRVLTPREQKFSIFERELLAVSWSVHYFRQYLLGKPFTVISDQSALSHALKVKDPTNRIARIIMSLQQFNFTIIHHSGKSNSVADYLSRQINHSIDTSTLPPRYFGTLLDPPKQNKQSDTNPLVPTESIATLLSNVQKEKVASTTATEEKQSKLTNKITELETRNEKLNKLVQDYKNCLLDLQAKWERYTASLQQEVDNYRAAEFSHKSQPQTTYTRYDYQQHQPGADFETYDEGEPRHRQTRYFFPSHNIQADGRTHTHKRRRPTYHQESPTSNDISNNLSSVPLESPLPGPATHTESYTELKKKPRTEKVTTELCANVTAGLIATTQTENTTLDPELTSQCLHILCGFHDALLKYSSLIPKIIAGDDIQQAKLVNESIIQAMCKMDNISVSTDIPLRNFKKQIINLANESSDTLTYFINAREAIPLPAPSSGTPQMINAIQPLIEENTRTRTAHVIPPSWLSDIAKQQQQDPKCSEIMQCLRKNRQPHSYPNFYFFLDNDILYAQSLLKHNSTRLSLRGKLVIPQTLFPKIFQYFHTMKFAAHCGLQKTILKIKQDFFIPNLYPQAKLFISTCHQCISRKGHIKLPKAPLQRIGPPSRPMEICSLDVLGPFPQTLSGNKYIINYADYFTRWCESFPVPDIKSTTVMSTLEQYISRFGVMQILITDLGSNFTSHVMRQVYKEFGIDKHFSSAFHPQTDGVIERFHRSLLQALSHMANENQSNWDECLPFALLAYRTQLHRAIAETPAYALYGFDILLPQNLLTGQFSQNYTSFTDFDTCRQAQRQHTYDSIYRHLTKAADFQENYRSRTAVERNFKVGHIVYLNYPKTVRKPGLSAKITYPNRGPYRITEILSKVNYKIVHMYNKKDTQIVHVDRLISVPNFSITTEDQTDTHTSTLPDPLDGLNQSEIIMAKQNSPLPHFYTTEFIDFQKVAHAKKTLKSQGFHFQDDSSLSLRIPIPEHEQQHLQSEPSVVTAPHVRSPYPLRIRPPINYRE